MTEPRRPFWSELKRRKVWQMAAAYGAAALATALAVAELYDVLRLPESTPLVVIIVLAAGFPISPSALFALGLPVVLL